MDTQVFTDKERLALYMSAFESPVNQLTETENQTLEKIVNWAVGIRLENNILQRLLDGEVKITGWNEIKNCPVLQ